MSRLATASFAAFAFSVTLVGDPGSARADTEWRKETGEAHGSQVASSEWLPIIIGGSAGLILGGVVGAAFDDRQPPVVGGIAGGAIGAVAGGAGGAWVIRQIREKDTRIPGLITGLSLGAGLGLIMFNQMGDPEGHALETVGKWSSLALFPAVGAVVGYKLASVWGGKATEDAPPPPTTAIAPLVAPVVGPHGATGISIGASAIF
ncbi:MAG: hypothetical protein ACXWUG_29375 [Polyangiales bacterium]